MDDLERQFAELECEVRQRECPHERMYDIQEIGRAARHFCADCGKHFDGARADFRVTAQPGGGHISWRVD